MECLPFEISPLDEKLNSYLKKYYKGQAKGFVSVGPEKYILPQQYTDHAAKIFNFEVRKDDIWLITFPRSGTTLLQEMIWLIKNSCDFKAAKSSILNRFPYLELCTMIQNNYDADVHRGINIDLSAEVVFPAWDVLIHMKGPRFIKTHLPFSLLPKGLLSSGAKIIYAARNAKDVMVSNFYFNRSYVPSDFQGDFDDFCYLFQRDLHTRCPFWSHINEGWKIKKSPNVLFLFYETVIKDMCNTITTISNFLNNEDLCLDKKEQLMDHLQIDNFRRNEYVNINDENYFRKSGGGFIRSGKVGENDNMFSDDLLESVNKWITENENAIGITFPT